jgi:hypothetical protein
MGFRLGTALGKLAGGVIRSATGGAIRPNFKGAGAAVSGLKGGGGKTGVACPPGTRCDSGELAGFCTGKCVPMSADGGGGCSTGFRLNKSRYVTRGGGTSRWPQQLVLHEKKSVCVKRRRINAGNGKAAIHAVRRLVSFYSLSQRVAKQLRKAASKAHLHRGSQRRLTAGRGGVEVVNVD